MKHLDIEKIHNDVWQVSVRSAHFEAVCEFVDNTDYAYILPLNALNLIHVHFNGLAEERDKREMEAMLKKITRHKKTHKCKVETLEQACIKHLGDQWGMKEYHKEIANALRDMGVDI